MSWGGGFSTAFGDAGSDSSGGVAPVDWREDWETTERLNWRQAWSLSFRETFGKGSKRDGGSHFKEPK